MRLYLIRHGESENNLASLWTGWYQAELTDRGIRDAERIRPLLEKTIFQKVYSSDLIRAQKTAEIALPRHKAEPLSLLREIHVGSLTGKPLSTLSPEEKEKALVEGFHPYGGEKREEFLGRVRSFLDLAAKEKGENVAAFCHGGFLYGVLDLVMKTHIDRGCISCKNCTVVILEKTENAWRLHSWINPV